MTTSGVRYPKERNNVKIITWFTVKAVWLLATLEKLIKSKIVFKPVKSECFYGF